MYSQKWNCMASFPIPTFMYLWATYVFPRSVCLFCELRGLVPNFHIQVSDLYIPNNGTPILLDRPIMGIYKSLTDTCM